MKLCPSLSRTLCLATAAALALSLAGCGASSGATDAASTTASTYQSAAESTTADSNGGTPVNADSLLDPSQLSEDLKIIYTASMTMETNDFDASRDALLAAVDDCGGYLQNTNQGGSADYASRYADYTARIPADRYREFLTTAGEAGSVQNLTERAEDVTDHYIDVEARLTALENQRTRLNELADQADTTADLLEIESQLSDVQYEIERYTSQMRQLENQVSYSTVEISLYEVRELTPTTVTFGEKVAQAFRQGLRNLISFCEETVLALLRIWPFLLMLLAVILLFWRGRRRRRAAKAAKAAARPADSPPQEDGTPPSD